MYLFSLKWSKPSLDDKNSILGIGHMCTVLWNLDYKKSLIFSFFFPIFEKESNLSSCLLSLARSLKSISFEGYGREMEKVPFLVQTYQYARSLFLAWEWEGAWPSLAQRSWQLTRAQLCVTIQPPADYRDAPHDSPHHRPWAASQRLPGLLAGLSPTCTHAAIPIPDGMATEVL